MRRVFVVLMRMLQFVRVALLYIGRMVMAVVLMIVMVVSVGFVRMSVVVIVFRSLGPLVPAGAPIERFLLDGLAWSLFSSMSPLIPEKHSR